MIDIAQISLSIALLLSLYSMLSSVLGLKNRWGQFLESSHRAIYTAFILLTLATAVLVQALVLKNFEIKYIAEHVSNSLPTFYRISALWAGQEGSLLLWAWLLGLFGIIVVFQNRKRSPRLLPYVNATISGVLFFFMVLLVFVSNPFTRLGFSVNEGQGMNPLLQNPGMIFHPPALYLGFVGFTVPFAFSIAALITRNLDSDWIKITRRWTLFAWLFLSLGNLLGAKWAYVELGWGGYWGWDPVENASFMPWLTGTAFLHSVMIQERKSMLKIWNVALIMITFLLTIFGTFLTRSGVVSSVHSFGASNLGNLFLAFLIGLTLFSLYLIYTRREDLRSRYHLDSFLSRESTFLFNNLILVGAAFAILWGTLFPVISEAVRGVKITVGPPFFNTINVPIAIALIVLTGICPLVSWRKASVNIFTRNFLIPITVFLISFIGLYIGGVGGLYTLLTLSLSFFVITTILLEFYRGTRARMRYYKENFVKAFLNLNMKYKRRYGGYVVHIGMIMIFVGITGSVAFKAEKEQQLNKGESMTIRDYRITSLGVDHYKTTAADVQAATLKVVRNGKSMGIVNPSREYHLLQKQNVTEVAILSSVREDLYLILGNANENGSIYLKAHVNPLVSWIWWGGYVLIAGTVFAMLPNRKRRRSSTIQGERMVSHEVELQNQPETTTV